MKSEFFHKFISRIFLIFILSFAFIVSNAFAKEIPFFHKPVAPEAMPAPGRNLTLLLLLPKTKDLSIKVRAHVIIDGEALDVTLSGSLDEQDRTFFKADLRAPISELAYTFYISAPDDKIIKSDEYRILRPCIPNQKLTEVSLAKDLTPIEQAHEFVNKTKSLEYDIDSYSQALDVLKSLEEELK